VANSKNFETRSDKNTVSFLYKVEDVLHINKPTDWLRVREDHIDKTVGQTIIKRYGTLQKALAHAYPEYAEMQRDQFKHLANALNVEKSSDWLRVTNEEVVKCLGTTFLDHLNGDIFKGLVIAFPDLEKVLKTKGWDNIQNQRILFSKLGKMLNVKELDDWYDIKTTDVLNKKGGTVLSKYKYL